MFARTATIAARTAARPAGQKRTIVDYLTKMPDKVMETKKIQMTGGTCQAEVAPTWLKQEGDNVTLAIGGLLVGYGFVQAIVGHYRLATGKGKLE
mmetsp:Transcript_16581/g.47742  ORF Transcript_16581/g.47742 Transcript_16581/m.47742 type:complete len:95 (+) Transcript_16581:95-379(+)|eukprot:CAMPEP_0113546892 /NCGR_PEP_ID=MMETSP0015_2-20120614/12055_1 /TAXON_ID=2838 /ORGANISM="Odontella" /LENGTH=94 /DNA_ID=CAMNT_0000447391 /DNA_START=62 /DNA_END=346 /DNA_ORIENTATION=- /assembly_acc=CAM_ASM_000160